MRKGGNRHRSKPLVDSMLLFNKLNKHKDFVKNLGVYESLSRNGAVDPKGLAYNLPLLNALIEIAQSAEVHAAPLKKGLLHLLTLSPDLNNTQFNGIVWVNLRAERITTLLNHIRRFARDPDNLKIATSKLTSAEFSQMRDLLNFMNLKDAECPSVASLKNEELPSTNETAKRVLKKEVSNVSVDSSGFPQMLKSPCKRESPSQQELPRMVRRRLGSKVCKFEPSAQTSACSWGDHKDDCLKAALGFDKAILPVLKKPAALGKAVCKRGEEPENLEERPWFKLQKTKATNPERTYITGNRQPGEKMRLIVEISRKWSVHHDKIADKIMQELRATNLTKEGALVLRAKLCKECV